MSIRHCPSCLPTWEAVGLTGAQWRTRRNEGQVLLEHREWFPKSSNKVKKKCERYIHWDGPHWKGHPGRESLVSKTRRMRQHGAFWNDEYFRLTRGEEAGEVSEGQTLRDFVSLLSHETFVLKGTEGHGKVLRRGMPLWDLCFKNRFLSLTHCGWKL